MLVQSFLYYVLDEEVTILVVIIGSIFTACVALISIAVVRVNASRYKAEADEYIKAYQTALQIYYC